MSSLYCGYKLLIKYITYKYFLYFVDSYFSLILSYDGKSILILMKSRLLLFYIVAHAFGIIILKNIHNSKL